MLSLEEQIIEELKKPRDRKERFNFTLSKSTKDGLVAWCEKHNLKESPAIDAMIRKMIPEKYFKS